MNAACAPQGGRGGSLAARWLGILPLRREKRSGKALAGFSGKGLREVGCRCPKTAQEGLTREQLSMTKADEAMLGSHPMKQPTISPINEDELQIHKLYRERIIQEDNLINHRMMWMVLSQAFLLATFGAIAQKIFGHDPENLFTQARIVCVLGMVFALASKLSIRAAQDEIDGLRTKYLDMYPPKEEDKVLRQNVEFWSNALDLRFKKKKRAYPKAAKLRAEGPEGDKEEKGAAILPGLTGSRHFHYLGHLLPKAMPLALIVLWGSLLYNVKQDIWHLSSKHWPTYVFIVAGVLLTLWLVPKVAKRLKNWFGSTQRDGASDSA